MRSKFIILLTLIFLFIPVYTWAVTIPSDPLFPLAKDPRALGMAGAMTALGDSPTSAIFNPALMGEYNSFSLKAGLGFWPVDETTWESFSKFVEYRNMLANDQEPPDDELMGNVFLTGYAHLGIGRLGLTVFGDVPVYFSYSKYFNENYRSSTYTPTDLTETVVQASIVSDIAPDVNGALTIALPVVDFGRTKLNVGANLRVNATYTYCNATYAELNAAGLESGTYTKAYPTYNYLDNFEEEWYITNWAIDLGAYLRLSDNFALGISAQNVYAKWIGGEYKFHYLWKYWDNNGELQTFNEYHDEGPIPPEEIGDVPPLTLKAGALLKLPVLSTRVALDVDLDNNFQPTLYRLGVEQPLLFLVVRGGTILDTNFTPRYYTLGAGINLLIIRVDAGLAYEARGSFIDTIQNTMPLIGSLSGSIQF